MEGDVFSRFKGQFVVLPAAGGAVLCLSGDIRGGTPKQASAVLRTLVKLIGAAIAADQELDG